ncbi:MAG: hypothetical protein KKE62_08455 [Proteobacteria bacterium]|nr:hypothetical protein [Pseudomonadota bacterium]
MNEATKIVALGACALEDIDLAVVNATGSPFGPVALMQNTTPEDLTSRLENLAKRFKKEIFKPTAMIKNGGYKLA